MVDSLSGGSGRQELVDVIRQVRSRWRTKLLLRGGIVVLAGGLIALGLASWSATMLKVVSAGPTLLCRSIAASTMRRRVSAWCSARRLRV